MALLIGALEGQVRSPALAAALHRASLFRMMEDFGHGIVDSRPILLLVMVTVLALLAATALLARLRGPTPADAPHRRWPSGWLGAALIAAIAVMTQILAGRHYLRGDWTRAVAVRAVTANRQRPGVAAPSGRGDDLRLSEARLGARARDRRVAARARRARHAGRGRAFPRRVRRSRPGSAARRGGEPALRHRRLRDGAGRDRVHLGPAFEGGDLGGPGRAELDADGEASPALRAWRGEAAFVSALLTVTSDEALRICFSAGHGEPDIESLADGGYATFADELRRDGDEVKALARIGDAASAGCRVLVIAEPAQALSEPELAALRAFVDGGGRLLVMLGPVFTGDGRAFAHVGLESFAAQYGVRLGDNLVVDPARASDVEGPSVWAAGPASYRPHPLTSRFGGRLTYWPRTREVAPLDPHRPPPGLTVGPLVQTSPDGFGETDLATIRGDADLTFDAGRDRKGPVTVAVAVERRPEDGPPTRLVFLGTGRLVMNVRLAGLTLRDYDADFVMSAIAWLSDRDARVGVGPKPVGRTAPGLTAADVSWALRLFVIGLPALILVAGAVTWARRRR